MPPPKSKWPDFLFAVGVRLVCGVILGGGMGLYFGWRTILKWEAGERTSWIVWWLIAWAVGGGIVCACTVPHWKTPWYKGIPKVKYRPPDES